MEVDVVVNPKKRVAEEPMEEIPFAKRTKFKELFPSVFSSVRIFTLLLNGHLTILAPRKTENHQNSIFYISDGDSDLQ